MTKPSNKISFFCISILICCCASLLLPPNAFPQQTLGGITGTVTDSSGGVLADADKVAEATLYSYQRGGATLLEVLDAQRTVNEVYLDYFDALAQHAKALVAVEASAGLWDIHFQE